MLIADERVFINQILLLMRKSQAKLNCTRGLLGESGLGCQLWSLGEKGRDLGLGLKFPWENLENGSRKRRCYSRKLVEESVLRRLEYCSVVLGKKYCAWEQARNEWGSGAMFEQHSM
jgi:hypothetical protein